MKIVKPLNYSDSYHPVIFLAGPIQGTGDWQSYAEALLSEQLSDVDVIIANPRAEPFHGDFDAQVDWEHYWLNRAADTGIVMFWCEGETEHNCSRSYAQTTRFELGWMIGRSLVVVGIDSAFTGKRYLVKTLTKMNYDVHHTLKETVNWTVKQYFRRSSTD